MAPLSIFSPLSWLVLLYFRSKIVKFILFIYLILFHKVVKSVFPSAFQSYWSSQNHRSFKPLYLTLFPLPGILFPLSCSLQPSKILQLSSQAITFRKISCFRMNSGICSSRAHPYHTSFDRPAHSTQHCWFPCPSPLRSLNTLKGELCRCLPSSQSMELAEEVNSWDSFTWVPISMSSADLFPGPPQVLPSTLKVLSPQISTCLFISGGSK